MGIESKARRRVIANSIASLSNAAIDVQGQRKVVIYNRSKYNTQLNEVLGKGGSLNGDGRPDVGLSRQSPRRSIRTATNRYSSAAATQANRMAKKSAAKNIAPCFKSAALVASAWSMRSMSCAMRCSKGPPASSRVH